MHRREYYDFFLLLNFFLIRSLGNNDGVIATLQVHREFFFRFHLQYLSADSYPQFRDGQKTHLCCNLIHSRAFPEWTPSVRSNPRKSSAPHCCSCETFPVSFSLCSSVIALPFLFAKLSKIVHKRLALIGQKVALIGHFPSKA